MSSSLTNGLLVFERFRLKMLLGRGGMGVVWLARDEELEIDIALKFLSEALLSDGAAVRDLKKETRRGMALSHPNIVRVYGFYANDYGAAVAMEYVEGNTLASLRDSRLNDAFEVDEVKHWTTELCSALHYAHTEAEIVHRDLKPGNLMIDHRNRLKVADFGIASSLSDAQTRITGAMGPQGTLSYMSPQQLLGQRAYISHDIYSLGATLYDLLTGKPPFYTGDISLQIRETTQPTIAERREELGIAGQPIPQEWEDTIAACLQKDASKRPTTPREVIAMLGLENHESTSTSRMTGSGRPSGAVSTPISEPTVYESVPLIPPSSPTSPPPTATPPSNTATQHPTTTGSIALAQSRWSAVWTAFIVFSSVLVGGGVAFYAIKHFGSPETAASGPIPDAPSTQPTTESNYRGLAPPTNAGPNANSQQVPPAPSQNYDSSTPRPPSRLNGDQNSGNNYRPQPPHLSNSNGTRPMRPNESGTQTQRPMRPGMPGSRSQVNNEPREILDRPVEGKDFDLPKSNLIFSWAPPDEFMLGAPPFDEKAEDDEGPHTRNTFSQGFWISRYEVTQREYQKLMGDNPSHFQGDPNLPVENVTWAEAMAFCDQLNQNYPDLIPEGYTFSLPTQAQFEYAAAGGINGLHGGTDVARAAWGEFSGVDRTQPIGQLTPNPWQIYDIFGNVAEWNLDWYADSLPGAPITDWTGPPKGDLRVVKGGTINDTAWDLRVFSRHALNPDDRKPLVGFRVALIPRNAHHSDQN
ncbi:MAG: SUMF1/EgtB/PvdO family nonheme iron enzyme [Verrucomicrobiota bacterium]